MFGILLKASVDVVMTKTNNSSKTNNWMKKQDLQPKADDLLGKY